MVLRRLTSISLLFCGIGLIFTGTVLFVMPPGRIAYWTGWSFLGLEKDQWGDVHIVLAIMFFLCTGVHVVLNWRALIRYLMANVKGAAFPSNEFVVCVIFMAFILWGTAYSNIFPFDRISVIETKFKQSWITPDSRPPIPHAELLSLGKLAKLAGITPDEAVERLKKAGWKVENPREKVKRIAKNNHGTPDRLWKIIVGGSFNGS